MRLDGIEKTVSLDAATPACVVSPMTCSRPGKACWRITCASTLQARAARGNRQWIAGCDGDRSRCMHGRRQSRRGSASRDRRGSAGSGFDASVMRRGQAGSVDATSQYTSAVISAVFVHVYSAARPTLKVTHARVLHRVGQHFLRAPQPAPHGSPDGTSASAADAEQVREIADRSRDDRAQPSAIASSAVSSNPSWVDGTTTTERAGGTSDARSASSTDPQIPAERAVATRLPRAGPPRSRVHRPARRWCVVAEDFHRTRATCRGLCADRAPAGCRTWSTNASSIPFASATRPSRSFGRPVNTGETPFGTTWTRAGSRRMQCRSPVARRLARRRSRLRTGAARARASRRRGRAARRRPPGRGSRGQSSTSWTVTTCRASGKPSTGSPPTPWIRCGCVVIASLRTCGCACRNRPGRDSLQADAAGTDSMTSRSVIWHASASSELARALGRYPPPYALRQVSLLREGSSVGSA